MVLFLHRIYTEGRNANGGIQEIERKKEDQQF